MERPGQCQAFIRSLSTAELNPVCAVHGQFSADNYIHSKTWQYSNTRLSCLEFSTHSEYIVREEHDNDEKEILMSELTPNHAAGTPIEPIDTAKLQELAQKNIDNPEGGKKKIRTHTEADGYFRNNSSVRGHIIKVGEPLPLLGDDSAPNPTEVAQAALGACINVGIQAIAQHRGVTLTRLELDITGDIDVSPTWGVGDLSEDKRPGVSRVDVQVNIDGDADRETLQQIVDDAITWSPVVNTYTRPATLTHTLVSE